MHVVVVGGGFGGIKTALELSKKQIGKITLISNESFFVHHQTFYTTIAGQNVAESLIPLTTLFENHPNVELIQDKITSFDPTRHLITGKKDYHYDKLVLALGSVPAHSGKNDTKEHIFNIKSIKQINDFHDYMHHQLVNQKLDKDYFVVGAGATGVGVASALNEYIKQLKTVYHLKQTASRVTLVEEAPTILPHLSNTAINKITQQLKNQGVKILTGHKVDSKLHSTITTIWTSGIVNNPFYKTNSQYFHLASNGRVNVNPYLEAFDDVYVIGDSNTVKYSGTAWSAMKQAKLVAKNITRLATKRPQVAYNPMSAPVGVSVGEKWAYVEWFGVYVAGRTGSYARRLLELYEYCQLLPFNKALPIWRDYDDLAIKE